MEIQLDLTRYLNESGHLGEAQDLHHKMLTAALALNQDDHPLIRDVRSINTGQ